MKKLKILTLNIWRYFEWEKRKRLAIDFIKKQNADIVFLQEAAYDKRSKEKWKNQVDELNSELKYVDFKFSKLQDMTRWNGKPIDWKMHYGLGILSKYSIKRSELIILPHVKTDKNFGFLHAVLETPWKNIDIINVHFENNDEGSKEHLKQTLEWCRQKEIMPIIAGDFNSLIVKNVLDSANKEYFISYKIKEYKSFPPTPFSYNKVPVTLDYILVHKKAFKMKKVECFEDSKVSDHKPVIAEVETIE